MRPWNPPSKVMILYRWPFGVQADEFDRRFVRLGARVAEEGLPTEAPLRERLGPLSLQFHVPSVGNVDQRAQLPADGLDDRFRTVAPEVAAPARKEIQIAVAFAVPNMGSFAPDKVDRKAIVIGNDELLEECDGVRRTEDGSDVTSNFSVVVRPSR